MGVVVVVWTVNVPVDGVVYIYNNNNNLFYCVCVCGEGIDLNMGC